MSIQSNLPLSPGSTPQVDSPASLFLDRALRDTETTSAGFPAWVVEFQRSGAESFRRIGFPSTKIEDWRFTNVSKIAKSTFSRPSAPSRSSECDRAVAGAAFDDIPIRIVFVDGFFVGALSDVSCCPVGVRITTLSGGVDPDMRDLRNSLGALASAQSAPFVALNQASFADLLSVTIADGIQVSQPIQVVYISTGQESSTLVAPRAHWQIGNNASVCIVESHFGLLDANYLTIPVCEIDLGEGAVVTHFKRQKDSTRAFHIASTWVRQALSSRYSSGFFGFGAEICRNEINVLHAGQFVDTVLNGLYMASGTQVLDCRTCIDHAYPNCTSHELYKGILEGASRGVFNGRIHVHQDAQKTDAKQSNQVLLLSDDAVIDTKPELEIYADDVRCTHGATVGDLDADALFYLRSRGVPADLARKLLVFAFANEIVQGIAVPSLKTSLESVLLADHGLPSI